MAAERVHTFLVQRPVGGKPVRIVVWDTQDMSVGRSPENDVVVEDPETSRTHSQFYRTDGAYSVRNMSMSNPTYVNGEVLESHALKNEDIVRVAETEFIFYSVARNPATLRIKVEYASQLKSFEGPQMQAGDGEATILGLVDTVPGGADDEEIAPGGRGPVEAWQCRHQRVDEAGRHGVIGARHEVTLPVGIGGGELEDEGREPRAALQGLVAGLDGRPQQRLDDVLDARPAARQHGVEPREADAVDGRRAAQEHGLEQALLGAEMVVQQGLGNAGRFCDRAHGGAGISPRGKDLLSRVEDLLPRRGARRTGGRCGHEAS